METLTFKGIIQKKDYGESDDLIFIGHDKEPLAEILHSIVKKQVSVRYYISDKEKNKEELQESFLKKLLGIIDVKFWIHYSEITGYLWTDEELMIGGHDLLKELRSHIGKFLYMEIDVH